MSSVGRIAYELVDSNGIRPIDGASNMERDGGMSSVSSNRQVVNGLAVRSNFVEFSLLIGGALATACAVAVVAMGVVLLLAR